MVNFEKNAGLLDFVRGLEHVQNLLTFHLIVIQES